MTIYTSIYLSIYLSTPSLRDK